jgi:hypothetical protein
LSHGRCGRCGLGLQGSGAAQRECCEQQYATGVEGKGAALHGFHGMKISVKVEQGFIAPQHTAPDQQFCLLLPQPTFASLV